jgi:hypothetical protein
MKRKILSLLLMLNILLLVPLSVSADTCTYRPPAKKGYIYVAVKFKPYKSGDFYPKTKVKITWGSFQREKSYSAGVFRTSGTSGVVIRLSHNNNDSVPLTVETDGSIVWIEQDKQPNVINYQNDNW